MTRRYDGPWTPADLLRDRAEICGTAPAILEAGATLTYADVAERAGRCANGLAELGLQPGDRIATMLEPDTTHLTAWFGSSWAGCIEVPVNTAYKGEFLRHVLADSGARCLVIDGRWLDRLAALPPIPTLEHVIVVGASDTPTLPGTATHAFDEVLDAGPMAPVASRQDEVAYIIYTSGTTGVSKGVVHTNRSVLRNTASAVELARLQPDDVAYSFFPFFHITARFFVICATFWTGGTVLLRRHFSVSEFWDDVHRHGVTWFPAMGSVLNMLLAAAPRPDDRRSAVRLVCAGAVPGDLGRRFQERFGPQVIDVYGLTETGTICTQPLDAPRPGTVGAPLPHVTLSIQDPKGRPVDPGVVGEICVRPNEPQAIFREYWNRPEATVAATRDLWFHTGDAGYLDDAGQLVFVDRIKDAIRRRGENISSFEIERTVLGHPDVAECAAYAVPSELGEDEVMVAVIPTTEGIDAGDLYAYCIQNLPRFAVPRYLRIVSSLPRTPSQRVKKFQLREEGITNDSFDREAMGIAMPSD